MQDRIRSFLAVVAAFFRKIGQGIGKAFSRIFPKRESKYFDADRHEVKYIGLMALSALAIYIYIEEFARLTTGPIEGIRWVFTHPVVFLYNAFIIFATMTIALLFKRRRFVWLMVSVVWLGLGTANGVILMNRMTPFTLYDFTNFADGLTIATTYFAKIQIVLFLVALALGVAAIVLIFIRSEKWKNIHYKKSIAVILAAAAVALGAQIVEKHFTLDCQMDGPDHAASTEPEDFKEMVKAIRKVEVCLGTGVKEPTSAEKKISKVVTKRVVAGRFIKKGETFSQENICIKILQPHRMFLISVWLSYLISFFIFT